MWLTLALRHWYWIVIGCLICALGAMTLHSRVLKAERDAKIAEIDYMAREAETFRSDSEQNARRINDDHKLKVEQARKTAYANYLKKYGANDACGISVRLPNLPTGVDEANSASESHATSADPVADFAGQCAETTVMVTEFQRWVRANDLPVK